VCSSDQNETETGKKKAKVGSATSQVKSFQETVQETQRETLANATSRHT